MLLTLAVVITAYTALSGGAEYRKLLQGSWSRSQLYWRWIKESWLLFGVFAVIALLLTKPSYLIKPIAQNSLVNASSGDADHVQSIIIGAIIGGIAAAWIIILRARRSVRKGTQAEPEPLTPRTLQERRLALLVAFTAGITEELFFRAAVPGLTYLLTGNTTVALVASVVLFGLEHIYQGWKGVFATGIIGWLFIKLFMMSGTILVPIAVHIGIDIYVMLIFPYLVKRAERRQKIKHT